MPSRSRCRARRAGLALCIGLGLVPGVAVAGWSDWQHRQELRVPSPGLVKLSLPADTLDGARPALEDLRVVDDAGGEVPYLVERPSLPASLVRAARSFQVTLTPASTVLAIETGVEQSLDGVSVRTPARAFIKAVQLEASNDQKAWRTLARGVPIFRQPGGAEQLLLRVPPGAWRFLRLTVDDQRSPPIPFTGAEVRAVAPEAGPTEPVSVRIVERADGSGETRLVLDLGAAHLQLAALHVESPEPLFTRRVTLAVREVEDHVVREKGLAEGVIYRVAVEGHPPSVLLAVFLERQTPARELLLRIHNEDSPPLAVSGVRGERRPVYLVFLARRAGTYAILSGNRRASPPRYDLASLGPSLRGAVVARATLSPRAANPEFRPPEVLPEIPTTGASLDVAAWTYRKRAQSSQGGIQQLELDLEVLTHAEPGLVDLRLVTDGRQVPYILEPGSVTRSLAPEVTPANDPKRPRVSRWAIPLPHRGMPVSRLTCTTRTPLFQREVVLYEEVVTERGERQPRRLGQASWAKTPGSAAAELTLVLTAPPTTDRLVLETDNGDNPAIELDGFQLAYAVTRVLYKATPDRETYLYYGNQRAEAPRYDLALVAAEMLAAEKSAVALAAEERLRKLSWREATPLAGHAGWVFWGVLALVVVVLLAVIARLLPKGAAPPSS